MIDSSVSLFIHKFISVFIYSSLFIHLYFHIVKIEQNRQELERLDQQMGRKKTELQLLSDTQERKQQDLNNVLHDAEAEISSKHREIKVCSGY